MKDNQRRSKLGQILLFVIAPIISGGVLYYVFCPEVDFVVLIDSLTHIKLHIPIETEKFFILIMRWYLLDFIWAFSFASAVYLFFENKILSHLCSLIFPLIISIVYELLQLKGIVSGTFDAGDIVVELLAIVISIFSNMKWETRRKKHEKIS